MKTTVLLAALIGLNLAQAADNPPPPLTPLPVEWSLMGNGGPQALPGRCELGLDTQKAGDGLPLHTVRCLNSVLPSFGGARYSMQTARFRGKRVRVSAMLMTSGIEDVSTPQYSSVAGEAGLWIGVGSPGRGTRSDRMQDRTIKGTNDWQQRDFVVDVPADNNQIMVGFWMQGKGQVWARDFKIEEVPQTVAVNFLVNDPERQTGPNLSLLTTTVARPQDRFQPPPPAWLAVGSQGFELCDIGIDAELLRSGQRNLSISCAIPQTAAVRQAFEASPLWGKRVRFSGWIKTENFEPLGSGGGAGGAGLLFTTDPQSQVLHANTTVAGEWQYRELVMNVPRNSAWLLIGLAVSGKGQAWGKDFKFEEVPLDTPATQPAAR